MLRKIGDKQCSENYAVKKSLMVSNCDFYKEYVQDMQSGVPKSTNLVPYITWKEYNLIIRTFFEIVYRKMIQESYVFNFPFNLCSFYVKSRDLGELYTKAKREGYFDKFIKEFKVSSRIRNNNYIHYKLTADLGNKYSSSNISAYKFTFFLQTQSASKNTSSGVQALRKYVEDTVNDPTKHRILKL